MRVDTPTVVGHLNDVTVIEAANDSDMALDSSGSVWVWGLGFDGELGQGTLSNHVGGAVPVPGLPTIAAIGEANSTDVAVTTTGSVYGWGANQYGQLCIGSETQEDSPKLLSALAGVVAAAGGGSHMLYLLSNGTLEACGNNADGQLGNGTTTDSFRPVTVVGLPSSPIVAISAGQATSLVLLANGQVWTWGENQYGNLGDGTTTNSDVPVQVDLPSAAAQISAGGDGNGNGQSLALLTDGTVYGWGNNRWGQLGTGTTATVDTVPVPATALPPGTVTEVVAGGEHSLAIISGNVYAWGSNQWGQIGNRTDSTTPVLTPVEVLATGNADEISATGEDSVALTPRKKNR